MNSNEQMERLLKELNQEGKIPKLLLHTCCAPCSTTVIERLLSFFHITVFYYNPNIEPESEYKKRKEEQKRLLKEISSKNPITFLDCDYNNLEFENIAKGYENCLEGGERCHRCYLLRLEKTAEMAKQLGFDYFGTSLTVSPYKNAFIINQIGKELQEKYSVNYLISDFKKKDGYKRSIDLSKKYNLYRQNFCGCQYSQKEKKNLTFIK